MQVPGKTPISKKSALRVEALALAARDLIRRLKSRYFSGFSATEATRRMSSGLGALLAGSKRLLSGTLLPALSALLPRREGKGARSIWWGYFPVALVAAVGLTITIVASIQSANLARRQTEVAFREAAQDRVLVIQREIKNVLGIVQDIASFFEASAFVDRREFRKFVGPAIKRQAGIKALEWVPIVSAAEKSVFVEEARSSFPPFEITKTLPSGQLVEAGDRPHYYPVLYIQPYQENKEALGLDLGTNAVFLELLKETEFTRTLQVSSGLSLIEDTGARTGIAVVVPVAGAGDESDEALAQLPPPEIRGFALGLFYIGDIVESALGSLRAGGVDLRFYQSDPSGNRDLLYTHLSRLRTAEEAAGPVIDQQLMTFEDRIVVGNREWTVVFSPVPERFKSETWSSWIVFLTGIAFTVLLTIYAATLVGRARQIRLEVDERTSQLRGAVQALHREVLERKSTEQELQRLNETLEQHIASRTAEAERRAQYLEQFAYVTSHDLKAPLRAVSNLAQWIEEDLADKLDDTSREQLALLRDRVRRMNDLIEGLLEYSRVGRTADSENLVDTRELVEEIIDSLSPPKGFTIKLRGEMPTFYVDRLQLGQVFSNLIGNSLKHHGGKKGTIKVKCEGYGDVYQFSVCDDGKGIAPEYHDKVFMMFQTLESSDFESSTGIGLALVKKIIEEHGGTIRLESALGEGTCFHFTWPKKRSPESTL